MSVYHGTKFGFVQSAVYDQMGVALAGRLANASDINLCDSLTVGEANGIGVGLGVSIAALSGVKKAGINAEQIKLPTGTSTAADFGGILIRTDTGRTDAEGNNYMGYQEMGSVLRAARVGGRVWVKAEGALTAGGNIYWIIADTANSGKKIGGFTGTAVSNDTVLLEGIKVVSSAAAGELALIELGLDSAGAGVDLSGYLTKTEAAEDYQAKLTAGTGIEISDENVISTTQG